MSFRTTQALNFKDKTSILDLNAIAQQWNTDSTDLTDKHKSYYYLIMNDLHLFEFIKIMIILAFSLS